MDGKAYAKHQRVTAAILQVCASDTEYIYSSCPRVGVLMNKVGFHMKKSYCLHYLSTCYCKQYK